MRHQQGFPERLREARKKRGLSHRELGKIIGKDRSTVCNYEHGRGRPSIATILNIADALKITIDALLGHRDAKRKEKAR